MKHKAFTCTECYPSSDPEPTPIQKRIEDMVTNGLGYHRDGDLEQEFRKVDPSEFDISQDFYDSFLGYLSFRRNTYEGMLMHLADLELKTMPFRFEITPTDRSQHFFGNYSLN